MRKNSRIVYRNDIPYVFQFCDETIVLFEKYNWFMKDNDYLYRNYWNTKTNKISTKYFHRECMGEPEGLCIDHIDRNKFNMRKDNFRFCTLTQNTWNSKGGHDNISGFKGVYKNYGKWGKPWIAKIILNKKGMQLGCFDKKEDAHEAFKKASVKYHGEFSPYYKEFVDKGLI